jgi:hypothetical protein
MHAISAARLIPAIKGCEVLYNTWKACRSDGFDVWVAASVVATSMLGREYGGEIRAVCIKALLDSEFFNRRAIPFLLFHGTWKSRIFAAAYLLSPRVVKRRILEAL